MKIGFRTHRIVSKTHKWLAMIIGFQLLLWFASGALMSFLPIGKVRGEHLVDRNVQALLPQDLKRVEAPGLLKAAGPGARAITLRVVDGRLLAEVDTGEASRLFDPVTGQPSSMLDAAAAGRIALAAWKGPPPHLLGSQQVHSTSTEYRGPLPAWRVTFADPENTAVYVSATTGRITAVRTGTWRVYDFFWGLHIMDWKNHENFNSPWLLAFAVGGLAIGVTGSILVLARWPLRRRRKFRSDRLAPGRVDAPGDVDADASPRKKARAPHGLDQNSPGV